MTSLLTIARGVRQPQVSPRSGRTLRLRYQGDGVRGGEKCHRAQENRGGVSEDERAERNRIARDLHERNPQDLACASAETRHVLLVLEDLEPDQRLGVIEAPERTESGVHGDIYVLRGRGYFGPFVVTDGVVVRFLSGHFRQFQRMGSQRLFQP